MMVETRQEFQSVKKGINDRRSQVIVEKSDACKVDDQSKKESLIDPRFDYLDEQLKEKNHEN